MGFSVYLDLRCLQIQAIHTITVNEQQISRLTDTPSGFPLLLRDNYLTLLHSERPKLYIILAFLSAKGLRAMNSLDILYAPITEFSILAGLFQKGDVCKRVLRFWLVVLGLAAL